MGIKNLKACLLRIIFKKGLNNFEVFFPQNRKILKKPEKRKNGGRKKKILIKKKKKWFLFFWALSNLGKQNPRAKKKKLKGKKKLKLGGARIFPPLPRLLNDKKFTVG